ncbi:MAK10-like protein [Tanacetum coccineum]
MGDENPIRTLGDYSKPSHEGYRNTIELPEGNNVVPLRSDTIREKRSVRLFQFSLRDQASNWLERLPAGSISTWEDLTTRFLAQFFPPGRTAKLRNDILMFQQHHGESLSEAWTRFKDLLQKVPHHGIDLWLQVQIFYDHVNPVTRRTIDQSAGGKLRDLNPEESWAILEDLALYDNESWNDPRDFAKPVKAIALPQDVPSTSDRRLIELENQVQRLMEAHLAPTQPTQVNKITTPCEICSGPHDTQNCMENPEQAFVEYASSRTDEAGGKWYTFKPEQNNLGDTYNPSWRSHPNLRWRQPQNSQNNFSNPPNRFQPNGLIPNRPFNNRPQNFNNQSNIEGLVSEFMASQDARLSKFEADFKQQQSEMTNKIDTVLKAITDRIAGTLPSDTVKNPKLVTHPVSSAHVDAPPPPPPLPQSQTPVVAQAPHTMSTIKLPILKKGEYDVWAMKMEHYLAHTDYPLWEVIQKGNGPVNVSTDTHGIMKVLPPKTAEETLARERERKARTTLLLALPEDHLAKFHKITDAKEMWEAIKSRFCGNKESKKNKSNDNRKRLGKKEESNALMNLDGGCVDWTSHSEDEQDNYTFMACNSSGSDTEVTSCSKECKESYVKLKKLYDEQREQLGDASIEIQAYTQALKKVEAQLVAHQQGQLCQMSARDKAGLGYGNQLNKGVLSYENEVFQSVFVSRTSETENSPVNDRYAEGMHAVPPPMTGIYIPSGPDKEIDDSQFTYGPKQSKPVNLMLGAVTLILVNPIVVKKHMNLCLNQLSMNPMMCKESSQREVRLVWNNVQRMNHQNQFVPKAVLTRTGKIPVNTVRTSGTNTVNTARASGAKGLTSPEQTATGKGISNPLMAVMVCQKPYGIQLTNVSRVNTPGSDENRLKLYDLMYIIVNILSCRIQRIPQSPTRRYPVHLEAPLSPDYVSGPEYPPLPEFVLEPVYSEFMPPEDDVLPAEEQPLPATVSPAVDSPDYVPESDHEEDPEEDDDEDPEEDPADYPTDRDDDEEEEPFRDKVDDEEEDKDDEEEEEHPAPADSVPPPVYRVMARISIRPQTPVSLPSDTEVARLLAIPNPPSSPLSLWSSPLPQIPSPLLPVSSPPPVSPTYPLGYRAAMIRLRAEAPFTSHSLPLPPPIILSRTRSNAPPSGTPPILPIPLPTSSPSLLLPSTDHGVDRLERDRRAHAHTALLMKREARLSRETWGRSMDASDLVHSEVMALRTQVVAQQSEIVALRVADRTQQAQLGQVTALQGQLGPASSPAQPEIPEEAGSSS